MRCKNCQGIGIFVVGRGETKAFMVCPVCDGTGKVGEPVIEKIDIVQYLKNNLPDEQYKDMVIEHVERLEQFIDLNKANGIIKKE